MIIIIFFRFAMMEEKVAVSTVLRKFRLSAEKEEDMPLLAELILRPKKGFSRPL